MSETETAVRLPDAETYLPVGLDDSRICYWRQDGDWWIYLPRAGASRLRNHTIEEHEDGTITVRPSIGSVRTDEHGRMVRHGYLTRGEWREC